MKYRKYTTLVLSFTLVALYVGCSTRHNPESKKASSTIPSEEKNLSVLDASIFEAALNGEFNVVSELVKKGTNVNQTDKDGRTALMLASYNGQTEIVRLLLEHKALTDLPDVNGRTALMFAASGPFPETVKLLLEHQADPNRADFEEHFTALMYAAAEGHAANVKILLDNHANPSLKDIDGDNALTFARNNGHVEVVKLLEK